MSLRSVPLAIAGPVLLLLLLLLLLLPLRAGDPAEGSRGTADTDRERARMLPPSVAPLADAERAGERSAWELARLRDPATGRIPPGIRRRESAHAKTLPRRQPGLGIGGAPLRGKSEEWSARGPGNFGGRTRALAVDVADPTHRTLLAGGVSGGMWRSEDAGASWRLTTGSSQLHSVTCVLQDIRPGHEADWWYGTGEVIGASTGVGGDAYRGDGIYRSRDGGRTWQVLPSTSTAVPQADDQPFDGVSALALDATEPDATEIYAATRAGIHRSTNGGATWRGVLGHGDRPSVYAEVAVGPAGTVYATLGSDGTEAGIFRSDDGVAWSPIAPPGLDPGHHRIAIGPAPSLPGYVFFLTSSRDDPRHHQLFAFYQAPGGAGEALWLDHSAALDELYDPWAEEGYTYSLNTQRGYNLHVTIDPTSPGTVYVGGVHLWRSTESFSSGRTAVRIGGYYYPSGDEHHADQHRLVFVPGSAREALSASDGGVHRTADVLARRVVWESLNNGYGTTQFYTVAVDRDAPGDPVIVGGVQDHGTLWTGSGAGGDPWRLVLGGDGSHCCVLDAAAGRYVLSTYFGWTFRVQLAPDGTPQEVLQINPSRLADADCSFINPFVIPPGDERVIYLASRRGVWCNDEYSRDPGGAPWDRDAGWFALTGEPDGVAVSALGTGSGAGHDLYYGTEDGRVYRVADAGGGGARVPERLDTNGPLPAGALVSAIAVHPQDQRKLLLAFGNYNVRSLWYSEDAGTTWTDVENDLAGTDGPSIRSVAILADGERDLWLCGTSVGLFSATGAADGRTVWVQEGPQVLGNVIVDAVTVRPGDRLVVAATHGRGIFSATVSSAWWEDRPLPEPPAIRVVQNAPNPFNAGTTIGYELTADGPVRLEVLDLRGRRVASLVDGVRERGEHTAPWDGRDDRGALVPSGVYLCRLTAQGVVREGKMVCVR